MIKIQTYVTGPGSNIRFWSKFVVEASLPVKLGNTHITLTFPLVKNNSRNRVENSSASVSPFLKKEVSC